MLVGRKEWIAPIRSICGIAQTLLLSSFLLEIGFQPLVRHADVKMVYRQSARQTAGVIRSEKESGLKPKTPESDVFPVVVFKSEIKVEIILSKSQLIFEIYD